MEQLSESSLDLWAKKTNRDGQELWLPLVVHLEDTRRVIKWLANHWLNDHQREILQGTLTPGELDQLVSFVGYFHDIGKATPAFQTKASYQQDHDLDQDLMEKLMRDGFNDLSDFAPTARARSPHATAGETLLEAAGLDETVGAIIGAHHGKPVDELFDYEDDQLIPYTSNYYQSDGKRKLQEPWENVQRELIDYGLAKAGYADLEAVPIINQPQAVILCGLLIMADWIASSEYLNDDPKNPMFPLIPLEQGVTDVDLEARFRQGITTWDLTGHWEPTAGFDVTSQYQKRWGFAPRPVQQVMSEAIADLHDPGMMIVEAPMGIGKTEIALLGAEQLAAKVGADGLFMGLPTQATTNSMFSRVDQWVSDLARDQEVPLAIRLMHGKAQFNREQRELPRAENVWDDDSTSAVVVNSWFSGKKSMLADFTIGTIDHLLLMGLKQKHLFLRHLGLSGKVVVIDEIHDYSVYMSSYLQRALEWLGAYHIPVIALSATLPKAKRVELLNAYAKGRGVKLTGSEGWQANTAYPLLTAMDGAQIHQSGQFSPAPATKNYQIKRFNGDEDQLVAKIKEQLSGGGVAGVIVNTVRRAQELYAALGGALPKLLLHSAFLAPDREALEEELQAQIGKGGKRPERLVVIGTQVLEQSLDIDFDVLFTDVAPMDLVLQRMGRLHRHQRQRPKKLTQPTTYVLGIDSENYGDAEYIYARYYLLKTDHFLPETVRMPDDISQLVQRVYDPATDEQIPGIEEPKQELIRREKLSRQKARQYQVNRPMPQESLHGWLDRDQLAAASSDIAAEAAVRDIQETLEVILVQRMDQGDFLLDGRPLTEVNDAEIAQQLVRLPHRVTYNITESIRELERRTAKGYPDWKNSIWLRGSIALPLDVNRQAKLNGWLIRYDAQLGLICEKEGADD